MADFRFEDMDIWKDAMQLSSSLLDYADKAETKKLYRFSEQLRSATMSITNNIAEGSGSFSDKDFANFLNISRRSLFECANILYLYQFRGIITEDERRAIFPQLVILSKKLTSFRKTIKD